MAKRGKKPFIFDSEVLEKIEVLASRGLAQQDIAYCIGIHPTTLSEKKSENEQLQEALKRGKAKGLAQITNALFEQALAGSTGAACFYLKTGIVKIGLTHKA